MAVVLFETTVSKVRAYVLLVVKSSAFTRIYPGYLIGQKESPRFGLCQGSVLFSESGYCIFPAASH